MTTQWNYDEQQKNLKTRNPYEPTDKYPITIEMLRKYHSELFQIHEDISIKTEQGNARICVGNLRAIIELAIKGATT